MFVRLSPNILGPTSLCAGGRKLCAAILLTPLAYKAFPAMQKSHQYFKLFPVYVHIQQTEEGVPRFSPTPVSRCFRDWEGFEAFCLDFSASMNLHLSNNIFSWHPLPFIDFLFWVVVSMAQHHQLQAPKTKKHHLDGEYEEQAHHSRSFDHKGSVSDSKALKKLTEEVL